MSNIRVIKGYSSKRELPIKDEPNTWVKKGDYKSWHIEIRKDLEGYKLKVRGSLHKFYHSNNNGIFTGEEVLTAIQEMLDLFEVDAVSAKILNIEVGINLPVTFPVYEYLSLNLLYHKKSERIEGEEKGKGYYFKHEDYWIKVYAKDKHILRFEVKYKSKEKLQVFRVATVADLQKDVIKKLADSLYPEWKEIIMRGGISLLDERNNSNKLTKQERLKLLEFTSTGYQQSYQEELNKANERADKKRADALRKKAHRLRMFCLSLINERGDQLHRELGFQIKEEVDRFKDSWDSDNLFIKPNVTISAFDKRREYVTIN